MLLLDVTMVVLVTNILLHHPSLVIVYASKIMFLFSVELSLLPININLDQVLPVFDVNLVRIKIFQKKNK